MSDRTQRLAPPLVTLALLVGSWELWVRVAHLDPGVMPAPSQVARALATHAGDLARHSLTTLGETTIGLVLGAAIGLVVAVAIAGWPPARRALEPLLVVAQTIPALVLAPLLVLALGFGWAPRIVVVVLVVVFPVAIGAAHAFMSVDRAQVELVRAFGATRRQILRTVTIPASAPAIFAGVRISAAYAVGTAAIAEQIGGASGGLGLFIARSQRNFRADQVLAAVVVIVILSLAIYGLVGLAARRATPWLSTPQLEHS